MGNTKEINQGEVKIKFDIPAKGKITFAELGLTAEDLRLPSGNLRMVFDIEGVGEHQYYQTPTVEMSYDKNVAETHWQCDFNEETILDKLDNHGHSSIMLMNRNKIRDAEHHHQNKLIVHAEFPEAVNIDPDNSYINLFK